MSDEVQLKGKRQFLKWVQETPNVHLFKFVRVWLPNCLELSRASSPPETPGPRRFVRIAVPSGKGAAEWWDHIWEAEILDYWLCEHNDRDEAVLCAAICGIWKPQDSLHPKLGKDDFELIDDEAFRACCTKYWDKSTASAMWNEARLVGFSVRRKIRPTPATR